MATPESYGTLSHLCASTAQLSAASTPRSWSLVRGLAAPQRPNAPSTCTQAPWACAAEMSGSIGSTAPVLTFPAWTQTSVGPLQPASTAGQRVRIHPTLAVGAHPLHPRLAQPQEAQRPQDGDVHLLADHDVDLRRPEQPLLGDVPSRPGQQRVPGRRQTGEVRHLPAGDEAHPASREIPKSAFSQRPAVSSSTATVGEAT